MSVKLDKEIRAIIANHKRPTVAEFKKGGFVENHLGVRHGFLHPTF
jgi:hypothetical protein